MKELILVDWNTLVFYTCPNPKCLPANNEGYIREYAYIQFGDDFQRVQYGEDAQIRQQKQMKLQEEFKKQEEKDAKNNEEEDKEKKKKKKNKKKNNIADEDPVSKKEQI